MARRVSSSQIRQQLQQIQNRQKQAIDKYNQAVRKYNRGVQQHRQNVNRAIDNYNREARAYNARVRENRSKIQSELARLQSRPTTTTRYVTYSTSVRTLHESYIRLEAQPETSIQAHIFDLSEREAANNLEVANALLGDEQNVSNLSEEDLQNSTIGTELQKLSMDLDNRWRGAVFSLNPRNPDAARHFCTSAREIFTQIIETKAPDKNVFGLMPDCEKTKQGNPTRKAKIHYLLRIKGMMNAALEDFIEKDISNILELFHVFNSGTHGSSGKFDLSKLFSIKKRVEDGILFLANIAN